MFIMVSSEGKGQTKTITKHFLWSQNPPLPWAWQDLTVYQKQNEKMFISLAIIQQKPLETIKQLNPLVKAVT